MIKNAEQENKKTLMILLEKAQYEVMMYDKIQTNFSNLKGKLDYLSLEFGYDEDEEHDRKKNQ